MPTIKKIEKIEVHQLHFSCQMADVQSSRNDERFQFRMWRTPVGGFHTDPVHRKERYCPLLRGHVLMSQLRKNTVEFPMVQKILQQTPRQPRQCCRRPRNQHCYYRRRAEGQQRRIPNLRTWRRSSTSPMPQDIREIIQFKHIDHEQVDEKQ